MERVGELPEYLTGPGRELVEREHSRLDLEHTTIEDIATALKYASVADLYAAVGYGDLTDLGNGRFRVAGVLTFESDRGANFFSMLPRVMVNTDDATLRRNRLALLAVLHATMNRVADLARLAV